MACLSLRSAPKLGKGVGLYFDKFARVRRTFEITVGLWSEVSFKNSKGVGKDGVERK